MKELTGKELTESEQEFLIDSLKANLGFLLETSNYFHLIIAEKDSTLIVTKQEKDQVVKVYTLPVSITPQTEE